MGVNCNYIISNGLKTNKWWGEEKNKFWMRVHRNCYNWNGWKQTNGEEWKNLFRFFSPIPSSTLPSWRTMPPRGRTTSPWWTHFQSVKGCTYLKDSFYSESLGDFRLAKCLYCDKLVRRGKPGCTARETTNSGMASHMRTKHSGSPGDALLWIFVVQSLLSPGTDAGRRWEGCQDGDRHEGWDCPRDVALV